MVQVHHCLGTVSNMHISMQALNISAMPRDFVDLNCLEKVLLTIFPTFGVYFAPRAEAFELGAVQAPQPCSTAKS
jgi:hypothetical protein